MKKITIIIGLCNHLPEFDWTKHNIAKDFLLSFHLNFIDYKDFLLYNEEISMNNIYWIIPKKYMNISGDIFNNIMLKNICQKNKLVEILVIHDDLDVPFGNFKLRDNESRGPRGHNGNRSIIQNLKILFRALYNQPIYLSLGIGRPENEPIDVWVLKKFNQEEKENLEKITFEKAKSFLYEYLKK